MRVIEEEQLDFDDVLIQPKCSKILSRNEVSLSREFKWYNADNSLKFTMTCIPVGTSNMAATGTCKMAKLMTKSGHLACLEKHIPHEELEELFASFSSEEASRVIPSIGIRESTDSIVKLYSKYHLKMIMVDVPNGYIPSLVDRVKELHERCKDACLIAGNVVDAAGASQLMDAGVKIVKAGIGNGCFLGNMEVLTKSGLKKIQDICNGDYVMTHTGKYEKVINKFTYNTHRHIIDINGIKCTPNHKFYVAKIEDLPKITEDNYKDYCIWVEAEKLDTTKYRLVKITPNHFQSQDL